MELSNGQKWRRHQDQLQKIVVSEPDGASSDNMYTVLGAENGSSNPAEKHVPDPVAESSVQPENEASDCQYPSRIRNAPTDLDIELFCCRQLLFSLVLVGSQWFS